LRSKSGRLYMLPFFDGCMAAFLQPATIGEVDDRTKITFSCYSFILRKENHEAIKNHKINHEP
jgi:hypothetical protein